MRAVIYCRVSTVEQASNLSLPTQEQACREYCARQGYDVDQVFVDAGESAKTIDRPEFRAPARALPPRPRQTPRPGRLLAHAVLPQHRRPPRDRRRSCAGYGISAPLGDRADRRLAVRAA